MADTKDHSGKTGKRGLWLRILLFVSLALNLLVIGIVCGAILLKPEHGRRGGPRDMVAPYTRALSDADRSALGKRLREGLASRNTERGLLAEDYRAALEILRTEPLDPVALDEVLSRQSERAHQRKLMGQRALSERLVAMSPDERADFADRLEDALDRLAKGGDRSWRHHDR
ncbi:periplasmic heavy metal sensor [Primorskyibacter marinus]|uniref:periplasmic heavy metal sensor n=1 Tax=Primorskyibacter marinus TaxID=1977320 RepID=UPI000E303261|nr:periplasmic heavy metal sensor [Primorskyibacter marinus]